MENMEPYSELGTSDVLLALVSLGFEVDECQAILEEENHTVESAIERLIQRQNKNEEIKQAPINDSTTPKNQGKNTETLCSQDQQREVKVSSRLCSSREQENIKSNYRIKESELAERDAKRRRMQDKLARQSVLAEIKGDREHKLALQGQNAPHLREGMSTGGTSNGATEENSQGDQTSKFHIKVKLPSGKSLTHYLDKETTLADVLLLCKEQEDLTRAYIILQPFPRREFTEAEYGESLENLGVPSSTVFILTPDRDHLNEYLHLSSSSPDTNTDHVTSLSRERMESEPHSVQEVSCRTEPGSSLNSTFPPSLAANRAVDVVPFRRLLESLTQSSGSPGNPPENEHQQEEPWSGTAGRCLGEERVDVVSVTTEKEPTAYASLDRNAVRGAAERRLENQMKSCYLTSKLLTNTCPERTVPTLQSACADCIALSLGGKKSQVLSNIGKLSPSAAEQVLGSLMRRKLLTGKILNAFLSCKLQSLDFSSYLLTSNEILESARFHHNVSKLNLSLCSLITDQGLCTALRGLRLLKYLNCSECCHVSDKSLDAIAGLEKLSFLNLDSTKISDTGLASFLKNCLSSSLTELSVKSTAVSDVGLASERVYPSMRSLKLDATMVSSLDFLASFRKLKNLSLSATLVNEVSLKKIRGYELPLQSLNLANTNVSDGGLQHLQDLPLTSLALPGRFKVADVALKYIQGLPLISLDLTDYVNITDAGLVFLGKMKNLKSLSLSNTKISDSGLQHLSGLWSIEELTLDNSAITEAGVAHLTGLSHIHTLSLSNTRITGENLIVLNGFKNLIKLNLSRTAVCDDHIKVLRLPHLRSINLDRTHVSSLAKAALAGCPQLTVVRAGGCED